MSTLKLRVIVESAAPLSESQQTLLANHIKRVLEPQKVVCYFALNPDLRGGIKVHFGELILDDSLLGKWQSVRRQAESENLNEILIKEIPQQLLNNLSNWMEKPVLTDVGRTESVQDSVANITGLPSVQSGEKILFDSGTTGMVMNLNDDSVDVCLIDGEEQLTEGEAAYRTNEVLKIPTGLSVWDVYWTLWEGLWTIKRPSEEMKNL